MTDYYCLGCKMAGGDFGPVSDVSALYEKIHQFHKDHPGWGTTPPPPKEPKIQELATQALKDSDINLKTATKQAERILKKQSKMKIGEDWTCSDFAYFLLSDNRFATLEDTEKILYYYNGAYHDGGENHIKRMCEAMIADCSKNDVSEVTGTIQRNTMKKRGDFDCDDFLVSFLNCNIDMRTGAVTPHNPDMMFRSQIPVKYNKDARCPKFVRFLHTCLPYYNDYIDQLEAFACGLIKNRPKLEAMFFETGVGDNGKSTFLNIINWFYGPDNVSTVSIHELISNRFAKARLENKRINTFPDIESDALENFGILKALVSGDAIDAEFKYQNPYTFVNYAKLFFSANELPEIKQKTFATFKRIRVTKWTQSFVKPGIYETRKAALKSKFPDWPDEDIEDELSKSGTHLMDRQFVASILDDENEKSGILNLLLVVIRNIIKRDGFFNDYSLEQLNELWSENSTMIEAFARDCLVRNSDSFVIKSKVYQAYHAYCRSHGKPPKPDNVMLPVVQSLFNIDSSQRKVNGQRQRVFEGLAWNMDNPIAAKFSIGTGYTGFLGNNSKEKSDNFLQKRLSEKPVQPVPEKEGVADD